MLPTTQLDLPKGFDDPEEYLKALVACVEKHRALIELHIVDFFTQKQYDLIDQEWKDALDQDDWYATVIQLPSFDPEINTCWPESLKEYVRETHELPLPRASKDTSRTELQKSMLFGMTGKKIHEVERMSTLIKHAGSSHNIDSVLDMGSGQGYLSRALAFHHGMRVLAVDMSEVQTKGAEKFDRRALYKDDKDRKDKLTHITEKITPENVSGVLARWSDSPDNQKWLICGLHACGDLSTMIMRLFAESHQVTGLVNVGCCYHYLSEGTEASGFPMSATLASMNFTMGTTARVLACHSPWHWPNEKEASRKSFQQHFFRALLQKIMVDKNLASASSPHVLAHRINKKNNFVGYVRAALKKFGLAPDAISADEAERYLQEYQHAEKQVTILWTLRSLMANVLESIVLVDRWLYLNQVVKGHSPDAGVWLWPLFDPMESPRNMVFVASK